METKRLRGKIEVLITALNGVLQEIDDIEKENEKQRRANPDVRNFIVWWCEEWQKRFNSPYHVSHEKEGKLVKLLLETHPLEKLCDGAIRFLNSNDDFFKDKKTIGAFTSSINSWTAVQQDKTGVFALLAKKEKHASSR
jgi:hypothetical protein